MITLCFASNNAHKLSEIRPLLEPDFRVLSLADIGCFEELEETQPTLEGNSFQKADYVFRKYNVPCIADDSGLEVEALNGAPGVFSARYAGPQKNSADNMDLLLQKLSHAQNRRAQFRTIITLVGLGPTQYFEGIVKGTITTDKRGTHGFGYDPIFQPEGFTQTFAQMDIHEKNRFSHRALAIRKLIAFLRSFRNS
jgi:XTP/dITP diphosphohydrolase